MFARQLRRCLSHGSIWGPCFLVLLLGSAMSSVTLGQKTGQIAEPAATAHLTIFTSSECPQCVYVKDDLLPKLKEKYGAAVEIRTLDVDDEDNYDLLEILERQAGDTDNELPVIFLGQRVLGGRQEIEANLDGAIGEYLRAGGIGPINLLPGAPAERSLEASVHLAYFHRGGCQRCDRVERMLSAFERRTARLTVKWFDLDEPENKLLAEAMGRRCSVPEAQRLVVPSIFVGRDALVGEEIGEASLRAVVEKYRHTGAAPLWEEVVEDTSQAAQLIIQRFQGLGVLTVMLAGLIDGVNPCAFATIVFLISYLAFVGRTRREVLMVGAAFTAAVFLTYFSMGLGLFQFLQRLSFLSALSQIVYALAALLVFILAGLSFYDYILIRRGRQSSEMTLQLPMFLKQRIHQAIRKQSRSGRLALGAFLMGAVVSLLELACTGQVYLPTIVFVTGVEGLRTHAFFYLFLYNALFVLPLAVVFLVSYMGVTSQQIGALMVANIDRVKLVLCCFFTLLGALLVIILFS